MAMVTAIPLRSPSDTFIQTKEYIFAPKFSDYSGISLTGKPSPISTPQKQRKGNQDLTADEQNEKSHSRYSFTNIFNVHKCLLLLILIRFINYYFYSILWEL
jgi:hypothetical protein